MVPITHAQNVMNLIQSKKKTTPLPEITLIETGLVNNHFEFTQIKNEADSLSYYLDIINNSEKDSNKNDSILQASINENLKGQVKKYRDLSVFYKKQINQYKKIALASKNEYFKSLKSNLDSFIKNNILLPRENEINYYLLENKLEDIKFSNVENYKNNGILKDSLDKILTDLYKSWFLVDSIKSTMENLVSESDKLNGKSLQNTSDVKMLFNELYILKATLERLQLNSNQLFDHIKKRILQLSNIATNKKEEDKSIGISPAFSKFTNQFSPSITIEAQAKFGKSYNELGILSGGLFGSGEGIKEGLYFNELSEFSIYYKGATTAIALVDTNQKTGLNYELYYMNKSFPGDSLNGVNPFKFQSIQAKAGFEFVIYKEIVSIYGNVNFHLPLNKTNQIKTLLKSERADQFNFDFGVKMLLNPSNGNNGSTKIFIDLNFMMLNKSIKSAIDSEEKLISNIKIGVQQRLSRF